ncbi:phosphotransferase family protein [Natronolimnohabitans innermongolicus]|uniref:Aminoglycoside phosphotransferase n=1 Tax=Natronolimnohabitans innermongolicus JCM 12255 TaxID=1227499 RepID=L9X2E0_9EURY|nr:phosphotransferase [Natronolimnohabitans innermongolicus]ELY55621.1 aminoglycoside phosphotransferase [Natronolimnohabitans innermongolicus JCM 12255]
MDEDAVARIVEDALERPVQSCRRPQSGSVAETVVCELADAATGADDDGNRVVYKRGGASVWTGDVIEPAVCELVGRRTGIPVPAVLATGRLERAAESDGDGNDAGASDDPDRRWAIYEHLSGTNPRPRYADLEPSIRGRLVGDAGEQLGRLHGTATLAFDRVGGLSLETDRRSGARGLALCEPNGWHAVDPGPVVGSLPVPLAGDDNCRPVLTHGDYQPSNLLVDGSGRVGAVLDWGNAHVTHAEYALARAEARFVDVYAGRLPALERRRLRDAFRRGYREHAPLEAGFERRTRIYKLLWLVQSGANYARIVRSARGRRQVRRQLGRLSE